MANIRCAHCGAWANGIGGACQSCGHALPLPPGGPPVAEAGGGAVVSAANPQPGTAPMSPLHASTPSLELARGPERSSLRGRTAMSSALRRASHEPVVKSSAGSRAFVLILLLVAAYVVYSFRS